MIYEVLNGRNPRVYDSGEQTRCFTFIDDAIEGVLKASESQLAEGEAFNIGSTHEMTIAKLAQRIIEIAGKSKELRPESINPREIHDSYEDLSRRVPEVNKAKRILGFEAKTSLDVGLRKTIEFFRAEINKG